jgi:type II secretory pathway component PulL
MQIKQMHQSLIDLDVMIDDVMAVIGVPIDWLIDWIDWLIDCLINS